MFRKRDSSVGLQQGPVPPLACLDFESTMKLVEMAEQAEDCTDMPIILDWMIRTLLNSLAADSAARIFLPKTDTAPFCVDDLIPISGVEPIGRACIQLSTAFVVAPVWNNASTMRALHDLRHDEGQQRALDGKVLGIFIKELNLAIIESGVHVLHVRRMWGEGEALLHTYSLASIAKAISTDGEEWYIAEADGNQTQCRVIEPRMAALYMLALKRYLPGGPIEAERQKQPVGAKA